MPGTLAKKPDKGWQSGNALDSRSSGSSEPQGFKSLPRRHIIKGFWADFRLVFRKRFA